MGSDSFCHQSGEDRVKILGVDGIGTCRNRKHNERALALGKYLDVIRKEGALVERQDLDGFIDQRD